MNNLNQTSVAPAANGPRSKTRPKRKFTTQYIAYLIHSFVGLKLCLLLALVLGSGAIAVLSHEIDWLTLSEMRVTPQETRIDEGVLFDTLQAAYPEIGLTNFQPNTNYPYTAASAFYNSGKDGFRFAWIDPYTGEVKGDTPLFSVGNFLSILHATLFLPVIGRSLVNAFGIFTLISLVTGLLAFPKFWRYFLMKPRTGNLRVFLGDLHKLAGLWSIWFLLIIGVSGTWWFYQIPLVLYADAPPLHEPYPQKPILDYAELDKFGSQAPIELSSAEIVEVVKAKYLDMRIGMLVKPEHNSDPYQVVGSRGEWLVNGTGDNRIHINPYDGSIISESWVDDYSFMQRFDKAMDPLHFGTWAVGGLPDLLVKLVWFVFGIVMTGLAVTGMIINYKRARRASKIFLNRSPLSRRLLKSWRVVRPWGGPMGLFKYVNVVMLAGVMMGTGVVVTLAIQGLTDSGYAYTTKKLGPWDIKVNAFAGFLEKDLPPIRAGIQTNFMVNIPNEALESIKFFYIRVGKPRTIRAPGTLIHGPMGSKHAHYKLPRKLPENAQLWITAITWNGDVLQTHWPLMPDGKETFDIR